MPAPDPRPRSPKLDTRWSPWELSPEALRSLRSIPVAKGAPLRGRIYEITGWERWSLEQRLGFMRKLVKEWCRDPHLAELANRIIRDAGVEPRNHRKAWGALLKWVQENIDYQNEPNERLQSPQYTLAARFGDCDDLAILLASLGASLRLPWAWTVSGKLGSRRVRWVHRRGKPPAGAVWFHIYLAVGGPPFRPSWWTFAEPTLRVPLGWDVIRASRGGNVALPEMAGLLSLGDLAAAIDERPSAIVSGSNGNAAASAACLPAAREQLDLTRSLVTFVKQLQWTQIVSTALPTILAAIVIARVGGRYDRRPVPVLRNAGRQRRRRRGRRWR